MRGRVWDWEALDVPRIDGRTVIVTGAASGLGAYMAAALVKKGGCVTLVDVDTEKAIQVADDIKVMVPGSFPRVARVDLGDMRSIRQFARSFRSEHVKLHILINNAGIMTPPYHLTAEGYESQWGVNHLGHFVLTSHLMDVLAMTKGSRLVTQSSIVHRGGRINFGDINSKCSYSPWRAYKQSKLATMLFYQELHRSLEELGISSPLSVGCHPGLVDTALYRNRRMMRMGLKPFMHGLRDGAMPGLRAALDPEVRGGQLYGPHGWMEFKGCPVLVRPHNQGRDEELARRVWQLSEEMTGERLGDILEMISRRRVMG